MIFFLRNTGESIRFIDNRRNCLGRMSKLDVNVRYHGNKRNRIITIR